MLSYNSILLAHIYYTSFSEKNKYIIIFFVPFLAAAVQRCASHLQAHLHLTIIKNNCLKAVQKKEKQNPPLPIGSPERGTPFFSGIFPVFLCHAFSSPIGYASCSITVEIPPASIALTAYQPVSQALLLAGGISTVRKAAAYPKEDENSKSQ